MIIEAISPLGARLLDTKRTWETAGASRTRKFMSIRATHGAAYNAEISDEAEPEDASGSASQDADDSGAVVAGPPRLGGGHGRQGRRELRRRDALRFATGHDARRRRGRLRLELTLGADRIAQG
jgi:hypothetical protein